jgi:GT2 family glycosyltransferase
VTPPDPLKAMLASSNKNERASRIALVATVLNERNSIEPFVESLLNQSRKPDEIIIVDGDSTDGTREILERFQHAGQISLISKDMRPLIG